MKRLAEYPPTPVVILLTLAGLLGVGLIWPQFAEPEHHLKGRGGYGIVDLELAYTAQNANIITSLWAREGSQMAERSLKIDFAFIPAYVLLFGGTTLLIARLFPGGWGRVGLWLAPAQILAGLLDALENALLLSIVYRAGDMPALPPLIAGIAASIKFVLLGLAILYWLVSGGLWGVRKAGIRGVRFE